MSELLEVKNIVKKFKDVIAVDDVSLLIPTGVCFGLVGPNGAGKTTLIEVIEDIISPTSGEIFYKRKPRTPSFREEVGIQFQQTALLSFLTVRETLATFQNLYQKTDDVEELMNACHLKEIQNQYNDKISGGQKQRLLLSLALINKPELMILDEPSTGLDPQARRNLWNIIKKVKEQGKTIILTTHYMEEAEYLCDEVAIMDHGKIIAQGTPDQLVEEHCKGETISLPKENFKNRVNQAFMNHREVQGRIEIEPDNINTCIKELLSQGVELTDMIVKSPNLENVFLNLTGRELRS